MRLAAMVLVLILALAGCAENRASDGNLVGEARNGGFAEKTVPPAIDGFTVELDLPRYYPEEYRRTERFFSGRDYRIVARDGTAEPPVSINLLARDDATGEAKQSTALQVKKQRQGYFTVFIPPETDGVYAIDVITAEGAYSIPIDIVGPTELEMVAPNPRSTNPEREVTRILRLGCESCYWESVSRTHPHNTALSYFVGGGARDTLVQTTDAWHTTRTYSIDKLTEPRPRMFRGDPKLAFTPDGRLVIASLLQRFGPIPGEPDEPITGGLFMQRDLFDASLNFEQVLLSQYIPPLDQNTWIIFDYEKIAIDTSLASPHTGTIYVFANGVRFPDGNSQHAVFRLNKGGITDDIKVFGRGWGSAVTSTYVGADGTVYSARPSDSDWVNPHISISHDAGESFTEHELSFPGYRCPSRVSSGSNRGWFLYYGPEMVVDTNGTIYVAWVRAKECRDDQKFEFPTYAYDTDVVISSSHDGGTTWSEPVRVNDDRTDADQGFPSLVIKDDVLYIAFLDKRALQDVPQFDVYFTSSSDGGLTWRKNIKINDLSVPEVWGWRDPGDYLDMVSIGGGEAYISHPCVREGGSPFDTSPSDACVSTVSLSRLTAVDDR